MTGSILLQTLCYFNDAALRERKLYQEKKKEEEADGLLAAADIKHRMGFWLETQYRQFGKKLINYLDKRSLNTNVEGKGKIITR